MRRLLCLAALLAPLAAGAANWEYGTSTDKMRGVESHRASVISQNRIQFPFPYGPARLVMQIGKRESGDDYVMFQIRPGQFVCPEICKVSFKVDDQAIVSEDASTTTTNANDVLVLYDGAKLVDAVRAGKHLTVEASFYEHGDAQFEFNVAGLRWP